MTPPDPHAALRARVIDTATRGPGEADRALREAAFAGHGLPDTLTPFVATIRAHAWRITDADVAQLRLAHDDEALFEVIVSAALGAADERLQAGLRALEEA